MNSCIVTVYPSAPLKLICLTFSFPLSCTLDFFMSNSMDVSRKKKTEDVYPADAPGPFTQFLVEFEFLIYVCYFACFSLVILCSLLCLSVFDVWSVPGLHSFVFR